VGLRDDAIRDRRVERTRQAFGQQRPRVSITEAADVKRGQAGQGRQVFAGPYPEQQRDRIDLQAPGYEAEHLGGGLVQPLGIVDDPQHRLLLGQHRQQAEHRQAHQEPVG